MNGLADAEWAAWRLCRSILRLETRTQEKRVDEDRLLARVQMFRELFLDHLQYAAPRCGP
jgi:hypothetical protein